LTILIAFLVFSVIVLFHELGHFLLAKKNKITVTEFSLGMGPRLLSTVKGETRYSLKLLPFGGSCVMVGEDDEEDCEGSFNNASVWGRISVVAAGPVFNFVMAFLFAAIIISVIGYDPPTVLTVEEGSPAEEAGLQSGDRITRFQGKNIDIGRDLYLYLMLTGLEEPSIELSYKRDGEIHTIQYEADSEEKYMLGFYYSSEGEAEISSLSINQPMAEAGLEAGDIITYVDGNKIADGKALGTYLSENPLSDQAITIGYLRDGIEYEATVTPQMTTNIEMGFSYNMGRQKTNFIGVLKYSAVEVRYQISSTIKSLAMLIAGDFSVNDLSGPVGIVSEIGNTYNEAKSEGAVIVWINMLNWAILLSANLGVMNLLPIPALDGGRLIFLLIEAVRRKPMNQKIEGMVHFAGFVLLMMLMVVVLFNDVRKLF